MSGFAVALLVALLALTFALSAPTSTTRESGASAPADLSAAKPGRDPNQPIDSAYTAKIKECTTEPIVARSSEPLQDDQRTGSHPWIIVVEPRVVVIIQLVN